MMCMFLWYKYKFTEFHIIFHDLPSINYTELSASHAMRCQKIKETSVMDVLQTSMQVKKKTPYSCEIVTKFTLCMSFMNTH